VGCAYRIEVSGGHTGSAACYYSYVATTREELEAYLSAQWCNEQSTVAILAESFQVLGEVLTDGSVETRLDLRPALTFAADEHRFTYRDDAWWWGEVRLDERGFYERHGKHLDVVMDEIMEVLSGNVTVRVDWSRTPLRASGPLMVEGETLTITTSDGQTHAQRVGEVVGDFFDGVPH